VSTNGVRFGQGHGYFDLGRALLCEIGRVRWELLPGTELDTIPPIEDLRAMRSGH
jgi:hypothetical protein